MESVTRNANPIDTKYTLPAKAVTKLRAAFFDGKLRKDGAVVKYQGSRTTTTKDWGAVSS